MSDSINETPCPRCGVVGSLFLSIRIIAKPLGTFSLSGTQMKFSGRQAPSLDCRECDFSLLGEFDNEGHATFSPDTTTKETGHGAAST